MSNTALRQLIVRVFRSEGLTIRVQALQKLEAVLRSDVPEEEYDDVLRRLVGHIDKDAIEMCVVGLETVEALLEELGQDEEEVVAENKFQFQSAFSAPRFSFDESQRRFVAIERAPSLLAPVCSQQELFLHRYAVIRQRISRHELFRSRLLLLDRPALSHAQALADDAALTDHQPLTSLEALVGSGGGAKWVLAMLTHIPGQDFFLEDATGKVPLDVNACHFTSGCFSPGVFVIAEGHYSDGRFSVSNMGFPPPEPRRVTRQQFPRTDLQGLKPPAKYEQLLRTFEASEGARDNCFVVLSDVWLDLPETFHHLAVLFSGFAQRSEDTSSAAASLSSSSSSSTRSYSQPPPQAVPPELFVLMGNFTKIPFVGQQSSDAISKYEALMERLASLIASFPLLAQKSHFLLIPGPDDPGSTNGALPRHPLPKIFTRALSERLPLFTSTSNPARVRYCTQSMVFFRCDLVNKLRRTSIHTPDLAKNTVFEHAVKTVIDQSHLCPFTLAVQPVFWDHDQALSLYPVPDVLVLGDRYTSFDTIYEDCVVFNPSTFLSDLSFTAYYPSDRLPRRCRLPDTSDSPFSPPVRTAAPIRRSRPSKKTS